MGTRETREKRRDEGGSRRRLTLLTLFFFFSPTRVFEQTLAPIRIAGLEQLDGPSTYRHAVQQQCSRCVLCLSWSVLSWAGLGGAGPGTSRRSRKRLSTDPVQCLLASVVGPAQALNVGRPKRGRRLEGDRTKRGEGEEKKEWLGVWALEAVVTRDQKQKNGKKATSE